MKDNIDKTAVRIIKRDSAGTDFAYWQSRPVEERLETLEKIRQEYHGWDDENQPRLQRVYRIVKRT